MRCKRRFSPVNFISRSAILELEHNVVVQICDLVVCGVLAVMQGQPLLCQHRQIVHAHRENV